MTLLLIDNYDSFSFNLVQVLRMSSGSPVIVHRNDRIALNDILAMRPSGIVLSPGPGHPANASDFGVCADVIKAQDALGCPILGVCLGHQGIVHSFGGVVEQAMQIMHGKTSIVKMTDCSPLFESLPEEITAMRYHSLAARDTNLPTCLKVTARDRDTQTIMAVEHRSKPIYGLQFHPESIGTPDGRTIVDNFVRLCA